MAMKVEIGDYVIITDNNGEEFFHKGDLARIVSVDGRGMYRGEFRKLGNKPICVRGSERWIGCGIPTEGQNYSFRLATNQEVKEHLEKRNVPETRISPW